VPPVGLPAGAAGLVGEAQWAHPGLVLEMQAAEVWDAAESARQVQPKPEGAALPGLPASPYESAAAPALVEPGPF
jgi:hypothetical protein